jgi:hypothetical protein
MTNKTLVYTFTSFFFFMPTTPEHRKLPKRRGKIWHKGQASSLCRSLMSKFLRKKGPQCRCAPAKEFAKVSSTTKASSEEASIASTSSIEASPKHRPLLMLWWTQDCSQRSLLPLLPILLSFSMLLPLMALLFWLPTDPLLSSHPLTVNVQANFIFEFLNLEKKSDSSGGKVAVILLSALRTPEMLLLPQ